MERIREIPHLRDRAPVFRDRAHAGEVLGRLIEETEAPGATVLAIPAGGVPVAIEIARRLAAPLDVAVVSKILLPWTTESGYGAVAWDGSFWMDEAAARALGLGTREIEAGIEEAAAKVRRRTARLRGERPMPDLAGRTAIVVDDGVAAGSTLRVALAAVRALGPARLVAAAPTGHERALAALAALADAVYCANVRGGPRFAVADAYEDWRDVTEEEAERMLASAAGAR